MIRHIRTLVIFLGLICLTLSLFVLSIVNDIKYYKIYTHSEVVMTPVKGVLYRVDKPIKIKVGKDKIIVPKGFKTDLASIPRILWNIYPPQLSNYVMPAIVHDYLYSCPNKRSRQYIDNIFYSLLIHNGVSTEIAVKFYLGVRLFGGEYFESHRQCITIKHA
jgi:hypothetical protein